MNDYLKKASGYGLFAYALFLPFSISGAQAAMGFLLLLWLFQMIFERRFLFRFLPMDIFLSAFLLWVFVAAFFSVHPNVTFYKIRQYWIFIGYFAIAKACLDQNATVRALKCLVLSAGVVAIYGIAQHYFGNAVPRFGAPQVNLWQKTGEYYHAVGLFDHHLTYGNSLILILLVGIGLVAVTGLKRMSLLYGAATCLGTVALVFSYARSAWMGFAAGIAAFAFAMGRRFMVGALIAMLLLAGGSSALSTSVRERLATAFSVAWNLERIAIWTTTVKMIRDHPTFGIGGGNFRALAQEYRFGYNIHWTSRAHAHNSYLQVAVENGFPGLMLFAGLLAALFFRMVIGANQIQNNRRRRLLYAIIAGHVAFGVSSLFQHNLGDAEVAMTWFLLIAAGNSLVDENKKSVTLFDGGDADTISDFRKVTKS